MGLDMYLYNKNKQEQLIYWRKCNQIHNFFVECCDYDDSEPVFHSIKRKNLVMLLELCNEIDNDNSLAESTLPTLDGFFFGSTDYDKDYFEDIQYTIDCLTKLLSENKDDEFNYLAWW